MPLTYPTAPPTLSGDVLTINRFLASPQLITRRLREIAEQRFISDVLLTGRYQLQGGAVMYEQNEPIYNARPVEAVAPGSEYPVSLSATGPAAIAAAQKWGQDEPVTDEAIKRLLNDPVNRAMTKTVNNVIKQVDTISLSAISSSVTQTIAASAAWNTSTAAMLRDVLRAVASVKALNQGYDPDIMVVDDLTWAYIASDTTVTNALNRQDMQNPIYTGGFPVIGGLTILPTSNSPTPGVPIVLDSKVLGGMADEDLGGPGYTGQLKGVQGKTIRQDKTDSWLVRGRRVTVPVVIEPACAIKITGIGTLS